MFAKLAFAFFAWALLGSALVFADGNTGALSIRVVDWDGQPVEGTTVFVISVSGPLQHIVTDRRGYAVFLSVAVGQSVIRAYGNSHSGCPAVVRVGANEHYFVHLIAPRGHVDCGPIRRSNQQPVQPGVVDDVYDIF